MRNPFGLTTLGTALAISAVSAFYSIAGLMAIFAGAAISVAVMGPVLEAGKLVSAVWLHRFWKEPRARIIRWYLAGSVITLILISSMGIFGYLSKAHIEQTRGGAVSSVKVEALENEITSYRESIERNNQELRLISKSLEALVDHDRISKSFREREGLKETTRQLTSENKESSGKIVALTDQLVPLKQAQKDIEIEVGPVKYVAALIFSEQTKDSLEKAVRGVIVSLIFVFDPLAVFLLIASQIALGIVVKPAETVLEQRPTPGTALPKVRQSAGQSQM